MKLQSLSIDSKIDTRMAHHAAQLRRILELERNKDYEDRAVIGGLDKFLKLWTGPALQTIADTHLKKEFQELFTHVTYTTWDKARRQQWAEKALAWLEKNEVGLPSHDKTT
ncbi:MAG: hypothetical protein Q7R34_14310, partial [Dehalococcoidia bacterium]|nr:hypothetical protein [Dehalococcoidia bacterium]